MALPGELSHLIPTKVKNYDSLHDRVNHLPRGTYVFIIDIPNEDLSLLPDHLHQIRSIRHRTATQIPIITPPTIVITIDSD